VQLGEEFCLSSLALPDRFDGLKRHIDPAWIEEALALAGTATVRRRRLPAEQVIWLVIGMALYRNEPIEHVVDLLDLALPDERDSLVARSAVAQARQRLKEEPLAYLFATTAAEWATRSASADRWRGLSLYGLDGSTLRVPDSAENRNMFGAQFAGDERGESGYPIVRVMALMALRSHLMSAFRFDGFTVGETTLAQEIWREIPDNSLTVLDRGLLVTKELIHLENSGNRHWLSRAKSRMRFTPIQKLGKDDELVAVEVDEKNRRENPGLPEGWVVRLIRYQIKDHAPSMLMTSLLDAKAYPAEELIALYHERWELEIAYDEVKTHLLDREEAIRSRTPDGVRQELWGIAIAYNLVRLEMERAAAEASVPPTRISFVAALSMIRRELILLTGRRPSFGTIPKKLALLRRNLKRLVIPERRTDRTFPRAVKVKMSAYPRKRPSRTPAK